MRKHIFFSFLTTMAALSGGPAEHPYTDVTARAFGDNPSFEIQFNRGIDYWAKHLDAASGIDFYGLNGLAVGDYDNDGWDDVYVCQPGGLPNRLFRNRGDGTFEDTTAQAGLGVLDSTSAALWGDYDNDRDQDLFVITTAGVLLFDNQGHRQFKRSEKAGFNIPPESRGAMTGAALADYNRDGFLDLYICQYGLAEGSVMANYFSQPTPYFDADNGAPNHLFRNNRDGTFSNVTEGTGLSSNNHRWSFAAAWGDYNRDGHPDLYVANDFGRNNLYRNNGNGTFTEVAATAGVDDRAAGMSASWEDYDNDGWLDLYISNIWSKVGQQLTSNDQSAIRADLRQPLRRFAKGNSLFRNRGDGSFEETTPTAGVQDGGWAWSSDFFDFNNDGFEDVYIVNGHVTNDDPADLEAFHWTNVAGASPPDARVSKKYQDGWREFQNLMLESGRSTHGRERNRFYVNAGQGRFIDMSASSGLDFMDDGRAFAVFDFDRDGDLDVITKSRTAPQLRLLRNDSDNSHAAVQFELIGSKSNRDAVGAKVSLKLSTGLRIKEVEAGSGFLSQHSRKLHFGLGIGQLVTGVQIEWPSGLVQQFTGIRAGQLIRIREGEDRFDTEPFSETVRRAQVENGGRRSPNASSSTSSDSWLLDPIRFPAIELVERTSQSTVSLEAFRGSPVLINLRDAEHAEIWVSGSPEKSRQYGLPEQTIRLVNSVVKNLFVRRSDLEFPTALLLDEQGNLVKIYRGEIERRQFDDDLRRLPRSHQERAALALPFQGIYFGRPALRLETYFLVGLEAMKSAFYIEALKNFQKCLEINPRLAEVSSNIGTVYARLGRLDEALQHFQRAARLAPQSADIQFNLGTTLAMKGQLKDAVVKLRQAAELDPASSEIWHNLGNAYLDLGELDLALPPLERALEINPNLAEVHNSIGTAYAQKGEELDRALRHFDRAVQLKPDFETPFINLGILYLRQGKRDKALQALHRALSLNPANRDTQDLIKQIEQQ